MIKAIGWGGNLLCIGLSRGNVEKLLERKPIIIERKTLEGLRQNVLILGGENEATIQRDLAAGGFLSPEQATAPQAKPGEVVSATPEGWEIGKAPDPDETARTAGAGEMARLQARVRDLERAAWSMLEASEPQVTEEQGLARANVLADLVGYPRPGGPPPRPPPKTKDLNAVAEDLGLSIDSSLPGGWHFTLFLYEGRPDGQIAHLARDPAASRAVVRRWLQHADAPAPKARG